MGRGKLPMELISNEKSRSSTFHKRKKGLKKKLYEFTTLCGVDACMIVYGPYHDDRPMEQDIWPANSTEVKRIIGKYKSKGADEKSKRNHDLSDFFENRKHKINDDIVKMRRANAKAKYPGWDPRLYYASLDQLIEILGSIDSKLEYAKLWTEYAKANQRLSKGGAPKLIGYTNVQGTQTHPENSYMHSFFQRNMQLEANNINNLEDMKPFDFYVPHNYTTDPHHSFDINSSSMLSSPTMMMMLTNDDFTQFGSSSSNNMQYTPLMPSAYYDPTAGLLDSLMYSNNPRPSSIGYYSPDMHLIQQQQQQQYVQRPIAIPSGSQVMMASGGDSQLHGGGPQANDTNCYNLTDFQIMNKRQRLD